MSGGWNGGWNGIDEAIAVADAGSFVKAATILGSSTSHVSRAVARLEGRLGRQLFHRTTRSVALTDAGATLIAEFRRIRAERDDAIASLARADEPRGLLRITCPVALGENFVAPVLRALVSEHPGLAVQLDLSNRLVDLVSEGFDLAIRTGDLSDSRLIRTAISSRRVLTCAAPAYLAAHGEPRSIEALKHHECLIGSSETWHFMVDGMPRHHRPAGRWRCNNGSTVAEAAVAGLGLCQLPEFYVTRALAEGRLAAILETYRSQDEPIWAIYRPQRHLLPRIRVALDAIRAGFRQGLGLSHGT